MLNIVQDTISSACEDDASTIADLVNRSYRPTFGSSGWTHEADLVAGPRTSEKQVQSLLRHGSVVMIMRRDNTLIACVHVLKDGDACWIGMLATNPILQGQGVGTAMLVAAEQLAVQTFDAKVMRMSVLSNRPELQAFYERRGFTLCDATQPYPKDDGIGSPMRSDLVVRFMEKRLSP